MNSDALYRYRTFLDWEEYRFESELSDIRNNRLTLVSPTSFNDPYDCFLPFFPKIEGEDFTKILKPHLKEEMRIILQNYAKSWDGPLSEKVWAKFDILLEQSTSLHDFLKKFNQWNPFGNGRYPPLEEVQEPHDHFTQACLRWTLENIFLKDLDYKIKITHAVARVACFSQEHDSMYFWSHYADSHRGICMEYTFKNTLNPKFKPKAVDYISPTCRESLIKKFFSINRVSNSDFLVLTKSKNWESEKEMRVTLPHPVQTRQANMSQEEFSDFYNHLKEEGILKKLDDTKCACGEFMSRYRPPTNDEDVCACIYCESCYEKNPAQSLLKLEYSYPIVTQIYLGGKFDDTSEKAKHFIDTAKAQGIPVSRMKLSKKEFALKAFLLNA